MALGNRENAKTPSLQINGVAMPNENRYSEDQVPGFLGKVGEAWSMDIPVLPGHPVADALETLVDVNRRLLDKIYILQMREEVISRQHEMSKTEIQETTNKQVQAREAEVNYLKPYVEQKEANKAMLWKENKKKNEEIQRLQKYVSELRKDVEASKKFADDIQCQLDKISGDSNSKRNEVCTEKEKEIAQLRTEVNTLKAHLATLENELMKAKGTITEQQEMMRLMENDQKNTHRKFQDDLQQVTTEIKILSEIGRKQLQAIEEIRIQNMEIQNFVVEIRKMDLPAHNFQTRERDVQHVVRTEIERLRDVMGKQWQAIKEIRAQNMETQNFVEEIRKMILPAQNLQTRQTERGVNAVSTVPVLPVIKHDKLNGNRGRKKS